MENNIELEEEEIIKENEGLKKAIREAVGGSNQYEE